MESDMSENRPASDRPKRKAPKTAFVKGQSGNPGGRPAKTEEERTLDAMCKAKTLDALDVLLSIMSNGENERNRMAAALAIIERGHGKPVQPTTIGNPDGSKMDMNMTVTLVKP